MANTILGIVTRYPLLLMLGLGALALLLLLDGQPVQNGNGLILMAGALLCLLGTTLLLLAAGLFKRAGTTVDPTKPPDALVTDGLYAFTRNPMYLGMLLLLLGEALLLGRMLAFLAPLLFFGLMNFQRIPAEEAMVRAQFGDVFNRYCASVRRWL